MVVTPISFSSLTQKLKLRLPYTFPRHSSVFSSDHELTSLFKSCNRTSEITQIHASMLKTGLDLVPFPLSKLLASSIMDMGYAASIFRHIINPNLFMFNTMLRGYSSSNDPKQALVLFNYMRALTILLDQFTFISTLKSCARLSAIGTGLGIHSVLLQFGYDLFLDVRNSLLHFYCVCRQTKDAHKLFDEFAPQRDLVSWNTLMGGYLHVSQPAMVLHLFGQLSWDGLNIGATTVSSTLLAVGDLVDTLGGESLHGYCIKTGFCLDLNVATALISMYGKAGHMDSGCRVFDEVTVKDVVLWNCLMDGYAKSGLVEESLALLKLMKLERVRPNSSTLSGLLSACASSGALGVGQCIHNYIKDERLALDAILGTALVDMYSKCGLLSMAINVFDRMETRDVKTWTAMILGFGIHGQAKNAIMLFHQMEKDCEPNEITFLAVLNACSHGGLVAEGMSCFRRMVQEYGLKPKVEHYGCIIDLLGRAGLLEEAHNLIEGLPIEGDTTAWRTLLAACRVHGNVDLGELVKKTMEKIFDDEHPADSIIISSTYAVAGRMQDHTSMMENKVKYRSSEVKEAGCSTIELAVK